MTSMMTKQCVQCSKTFKLTDTDLDFLRRIEVEVPTLCPQCSEQRRLIWRNEHSLYQSTCFNCKKPMVSMFSQDKPNVVYCNECWWSDDFNPLDFGRPYDETRPFFEQLNELILSTPLVNLGYATSENSDYTNFAVSNKNCYLLGASDYNEDCAYSSYMFKSRDCIDGLFVNNCDSSYELVDCDNCYGSQHLQNCKQCTDCFYSFDLQSCTDCFGCVGLRHKQYYIFNEAYSKEEYVKKVAELKQKPDLVQKKLAELKVRHPHKYAFNLNSNNSVGDYLTNCESCENCFDMIQSVDCRYTALGFQSKDCMRSNGVPNSELVYESVGIPEDYNIKFSVLIWPRSTNLEYCFFARASNDCFGSVALNKNRYVILNTQYSKEEYDKLRAKIIADMSAKGGSASGGKSAGEYGEFLPMKYSPFAYNETAANDYYPLEKEAINMAGLTYKEPEVIQANTSEGVATCEVCARPFRYTTQETAFYERHGITAPLKCFEDRRKARLAKRNPRSFWRRQCMCTQPDHEHKGKQCETEFETTYSSDRSELVYCEVCYQKEIL